MGKKMRLLAFALVMTLLFSSMSVSAAPMNDSSYATTRAAGPISLKGWFQSIWDKITGNNENSENNQPGEQQNNQSQNNDNSVKLSLVEDETTVTNGDMLRASTYAIEDRTLAKAAAPTNIKYFPVTMFDYDQKAFNNVLKAKEYQPGLTKWNGIYMGNDSGEYTYPGEIIYGGTVNGETIHYKRVTNPFGSDGKPNLQVGKRFVLVSATEGSDGNSHNGQFLAVGTRGTDIISVSNTQKGEYANPIDRATMWTLSEYTSTKKVYLKTGSMYLRISDTGGPKLGGKKSFEMVSFPDDSGRIMLKQDGTYLNKTSGFNHTTGGKFGAYNSGNDAGSSFYLYEVVTGTKKVTDIPVNIPFENHNQWLENKLHQELAKHELDAHGNIQFNHPDAGLFTSEPVAGKKIYTKVGLPFEYDAATGQYSFNAKKRGAWFDGTPKSNVNLHYSEVPQAHTGGVQDNSSAGWFPYNDSTNVEPTKIENAQMAKVVRENRNYYFGMAASIDFTMTSDGKLKNGKDIVFDFSGDDDVWVFIDGKLVLDIGGIHNRIDGSINFAKGTWSINNTYENTNQATDAHNGQKNTAGNLWEKIGVSDLTTFAAKETHTLTVFYLERGAGASNCEITFNLPMKDYVKITKDATKDSTNSELTPAEQAAVNKMDFKFKVYVDNNLYKNQSYTVLNSLNQNEIETRNTGEQGIVLLRNQETARFTTDFSTTGENWKVEEVDPGNAFVANDTAWTVNKNTVDGKETFIYKGLVTEPITVKGSYEASGTLDYVCENILNRSIPNPGVEPQPDRIVVDYGLPVEINVKENDYFRGDTYKIVGINGTVTPNGDGYTDGSHEGKFGTIKIKDAENGILEYQLNKQLTDIEKINYIIEITKTDATADVPGAQTTTRKLYKIGEAMVIPATTMYYEEDFKTAPNTTMIQFRNDTEYATWNLLDDNKRNPLQETGVVGQRAENSPYGTDSAYLDDNKDSNGTSMWASTAEAPAKFNYTFTGTGTTFFARTSNTSGYMRVVLVDKKTDKEIKRDMIDTKYINNENNILYNIPVYTVDQLPYGTYTVYVTVAKPTTDQTMGNELWVDGIRIQNPMNPSVGANYEEALQAYAEDGESNVNIVTLRDKLLSQKDQNGQPVWESGSVVLTDVTKKPEGAGPEYENGKIILASEYQSFGPKEEVYLKPGYKISFALQKWDAKHHLYLGLKAPFGNAGAIIKINGHLVTLNNTVDCYYEISKYLKYDTNKTAKVEITCDTGIVSITNIKTTGPVKFDIIPTEATAPVQ